MIRVDVGAFGSCGVIIECPSGVEYSNQSGGYACRDMSLEGAYVPLGIPDKALEQYFVGDKYRGHCYSGIDREDADLIDGWLVNTGFRVDREMLADSMEAWVWVVPAPVGPGWGYVSGVGELDYAVLVWGNSD